MTMPEVFHWWQGRSGSWFIHTAYPIYSVPDCDFCNYIFVRRRSDGVCEPLYIGQSGEGRVRLRAHEKFLPAIFIGANEIHMHFLARSKQLRVHVETDLRNGHWTSLNEQPSAASPSLGGGVTTPFNLGAALGIVPTV
jgi:hypothetical protein